MKESRNHPLLTEETTEQAHHKEQSRRGRPWRLSGKESACWCSGHGRDGSPVREDPTARGNRPQAPKRLGLRAGAQQLQKPARPTARAPQPEKTPQGARTAQLPSSPHWPRLEKAHMHQRRPSTARNNLKKYVCIYGEGNGTPLQYSCLENPMDGGAWWLQSMGSLRVKHD